MSKKEKHAAAKHLAKKLHAMDNNAEAIDNAAELLRAADALGDKLEKKLNRRPTILECIVALKISGFRVNEDIAEAVRQFVKVIPLAIGEMEKVAREMKPELFNDESGAPLSESEQNGTDCNDSPKQKPAAKKKKRKA